MLQNQVFIALLIFLLTYSLIISNKTNRTATAMFGAILMVVFQVIPQVKAFEAVDFNTIGLLIGMMIIVLILMRTGVFQYIAIRTAKASKGNPWKVLVMFSSIIAIASAFLDNVTTILLIAPVALVITDILNLNPTPFMFAAIFAANIGGTATLVGDPPNIMIGGATGLGFMDFIYNLSPVVLIIFVTTLFMMKFIFKKELTGKKTNNKELLKLDEQKTIRDKGILAKCVTVLTITIVGFIFHEQLSLEPATIALFGAALLMLLCRIQPEDILFEIEWSMVFFFIGIFVLVGAIEEVGIITYLAEKLLGATQGNLVTTMLIILWLSAILSAFVDNVPFVAAMIPLIQNIEVLSDMNTVPLWLALSLGACLGGNGSLVGASANLVTIAMLEKRGFKVGFMQYFKMAFPLMLASMIISTIYLVVFYV